MIDFINGWAKQIIICLMIVIIFELIIPEGKNKKYIKMVMGLFILYSIISPFFGDKINNIRFNEIVIETSQENFNNISTDKVVANIYEDKIKTNISETLSQNGYNSKKINLKINYEEGENYGMIEYIEIKISDNNKNENIKIDKVEVGESIKEIDSEEKENIENIISENYGVKKENIIIGR